jgi:2-polyprenyl-3-methyl-5-hydroxy-6-metoxy-1,4-benzoquinol methylase
MAFDYTQRSLIHETQNCNTVSRMKHKINQISANFLRPELRNRLNRHAEYQIPDAKCQMRCVWYLVLAI